MKTWTRSGTVQKRIQFEQAARRINTRFARNPMSFRALRTETAMKSLGTDLAPITGMPPLVPHIRTIYGGYQICLRRISRVSLRW